MSRPASSPGDSRPGTGTGRSVGEVVLTAAALDGAGREGYLRAVAEADPDLAAAARRRLAAAADLSDTFLETSATDRLGGDVEASEAEVPAPPAAGLPPEERYELGECLGAGGMGRVVVAHDRQLGRAVALKLLVHEDPEVLRLFLREARAQARVRHPNVLDVYDSGELDGQPYIAMRYVAGGTLAEVGPTLSLEQRVRLLAQVAEGLHAAHWEGLLHRDLKPSNVLVERTADGELVAQVIDFGLAADLEDASDPAAGALAGSPHFIAPERLRRPEAPADRRADVYGLGMTLYHLFTGALPFAGEETVEVLRRVLHQEPPPPRRLAPSLPAELEAVVLRAIAPDPADRYASARAVADDLRRYLDGEVVEAYAAGLAYRLTRFVLRNRLVTGLAAAVVVSLLAASIAVGVFALRADAARERAELRHGQAEELIRFMVVDLRERLETLGRLDVLDTASRAAGEYFAAVPADELSDEELLRRSRMLYQIGDVRIRQGDLAGAEAPMGESLALARRLAERDPEDGERLFELGQSLFWVGFVHWEQGDLAAAHEPFERYLEVSRRLVARDPGNPEWRRELSYAHSNLGSLLEARGDLERALEQFRATLAIDRELLAADPDAVEARSELAATHNTLGVVLEGLGRLPEARKHLEADLAIRRTLAAEAPEDPRARERLATSLSHAGIHLSLLGDWAGSARRLEEAQDLLVALVAHDPDNAAWRFRLAWAHLNLGRAAFARGDAAAAEASWRRARREVEELPAEGAVPHAWRRTEAVALYHLALAKRARGESFGEELGRAVELLEELAGERPTDRSVHRWLSQSLLLVGAGEPTPAAAGAAFIRAAEAVQPFARGSRDGRVLAPWAAALGCLGRLDEARRAIETLAAQGYAEPGLAGLCTHPTPGPAPY